jgi:hypothetical protein
MLDHVAQLVELGGGHTELLAEQVVRGKVKLTAQQMRMLVELLPYYSPKLTAVAVGHLTGEDFYNRLERAINRSERARLIEGRVIRDE